MAPPILAGSGRGIWAKLLENFGVGCKIEENTWMVNVRKNPLERCSSETFLPDNIDVPPLMQKNPGAMPLMMSGGRMIITSEYVVWNLNQYVNAECLWKCIHRPTSLAHVWAVFKDVGGFIGLDGYLNSFYSETGKGWSDYFSMVWSKTAGRLRKCDYLQRICLELFEISIYGIIMAVGLAAYCCYVTCFKTWGDSCNATQPPF